MVIKSFEKASHTWIFQFVVTDEMELDFLTENGNTTFVFSQAHAAVLVKGIWKMFLTFLVLQKAMVGNDQGKMKEIYPV